MHKCILYDNIETYTVGPCILNTLYKYTSFLSVDFQLYV